jgi:REP element-mobilizing transposase RayT
MGIKYPERHSIRLRGFNYSQPGWYFVTICTDGRQHLFGNIVNGEMRLSSYGQIANFAWVKLRARFPHIRLDQFVVMPNHVHGVINIVKSRGRENRAPTLGQIIAYYKYQTTQSFNNTHVGAGSSRPRTQRSNSCTKLWQRNYHDHIIRDSTDLHRIQEYIRDNPTNWETDTLNC